MWLRMEPFPPSFFPGLLPKIPSVPLNQECGTVFPLGSPRCSLNTDRPPLPPQSLSTPHCFPVFATLRLCEIILPICHCCLLPAFPQRCLSPGVLVSTTPPPPPRAQNKAWFHTVGWRMMESISPSDTRAGSPLTGRYSS